MGSKKDSGGSQFRDGLHFNTSVVGWLFRTCAIFALRYKIISPLCWAPVPQRAGQKWFRWCAGCLSHWVWLSCHFPRVHPVACAQTAQHWSVVSLSLGWSCVFLVSCLLRDLIHVPFTPDFRQPSNSIYYSWHCPFIQWLFIAQVLHAGTERPNRKIWEPSNLSFVSQVCHLLAVWAWASNFRSACLDLFFCSMGIKATHELSTSEIGYVKVSRTYVLLQELWLWESLPSKCSQSSERGICVERKVTIQDAVPHDENSDKDLCFCHFPWQCPLSFALFRGPAPLLWTSVFLQMICSYLCCLAFQAENLALYPRFH